MQLSPYEVSGGELQCQKKLMVNCGAVSGKSWIVISNPKQPLLIAIIESPIKFILSAMLLFIPNIHIFHRHKMYISE